VSTVARLIYAVGVIAVVAGAIAGVAWVMGYTGFATSVIGLVTSLVMHPIAPQIVLWFSIGCEVATDLHLIADS
jgi:uncharacterized metal-binding protein